jgi:hypothetical protein
VSGLENLEYGRRDPLRWPHDTLYPQKVGINSLGRYSSLEDWGQGVFFYPRDRPWRPIGLWDVKYCLDSRLTDGGKVVSPKRSIVSVLDVILTRMAER